MQPGLLYTSFSLLVKQSVKEFLELNTAWLLRIIKSHALFHNKTSS